MVTSILEYACEAVAVSLLAATTIEILLYAWGIQDPPLAIASRLLILAIPPVAPLLFGLADPQRESERFRQMALLDLHNWLGPEASLSQPGWLLLAVAMAATTVLLATLSAVGFLRGIEARRPPDDASASKLPERLSDAVERLIARGMSVPTVLLTPHHGPIAFTVGVRQPTVLVSGALVDLLDDEELEAVLAHEAAHVARRDNWLGWLAFVLRIASFYNPVVQFAYHSIGHDVERVCDSEAGRVTGRPLALASALIKVYKASRWTTSEEPGWSNALNRQVTALEVRASRALVEDRVERLVHSETVHPTTFPRLRLFLAAAALLALSYYVV